jgi:hypothetical protein
MYKCLDKEQRERNRVFVPLLVSTIPILITYLGNIHISYHHYSWLSLFSHSSSQARKLYCKRPSLSLSLCLFCLWLERKGRERRALGKGSPHALYRVSTYLIQTIFGLLMFLLDPGTTTPVSSRCRRSYWERSHHPPPTSCSQVPRALPLQIVH